jgi:F0F1-type ATP synthase membrane subunit c/vacuolar-type H+-ATPase subunit K
MQNCWQRNRCALADFMQAAQHAAMREAVLTTGPGNVSGIMSGKVSGKILAAVGRQPGIAIPQLAELIGVSTRTIGGICANCRSRASCDAWAGPRVAIGK